MEHTETPWKAWPNLLHEYTLHHFGDKPSAGDVIGTIAKREDAEFAVQAVNAHEGLVEACDIALHVFDRIARETPWSETLPDWWLDMMARMVVVRAALRKAGAL